MWSKPYRLQTSKRSRFGCRRFGWWRFGLSTFLIRYLVSTTHYKLDGTNQDSSLLNSHSSHQCLWCTWPSSPCFVEITRWTWSNWYTFQWRIQRPTLQSHCGLFLLQLPCPERYTWLHYMLMRGSFTKRLPDCIREDERLAFHGELLHLWMIRNAK